MENLKWANNTIPLGAGGFHLFNQVETLNKKLGSLGDLDGLYLTCHNTVGIQTNHGLINLDTSDCSTACVNF